MKTESFTSEITHEARAMLAHALRCGKAVPGWIPETIAQVDDALRAQGEAGADSWMTGLSRAHRELMKLIEPFTPDLVVMLELESKRSPFQRALGQIRIQRSFAWLTLASLVTFIALSLSEYVNDPKYGNLFESSGWPLLANELFCLSSASIGAAFSNLFQIDRDLSAGTFLPRNQSSHWVQFALGLVAGLLLSTVMIIQSEVPKGGAATSQLYYTAGILAFMGGSSSSVVQRILQRMTETLESILKGSAEQDVQSLERMNKQRLEEALAKDRVRIQLLRLDMQRRLAGGEDTEALRKAIVKAIHVTLSNQAPSPEDSAPEEPERSETLRSPAVQQPDTKKANCEDISPSP